MDKIQLAFAAINERIIEKIPENVVVTGNTFAYWGKDNRYPNFLYEAYKDCPTLQTIINGFTDYIVGDGVSSTILARPNEYQDWDEFVTSVAGDYILFGIAYIQVIRDNSGNINSLHWLDSRFVRTDDDNQVFFYNEDFAKKYVRATKQLIYPKFLVEGNAPASVICIKTPFSRETYGTPVYESAIKSIMTEIKIDDFHLSELDNNFAASTIISFNSGIPTDEQKDEIEKLIAKKFTGSENAGRFLISFTNGKENAPSVEKLNTDDFDKRYESLAQKTQKQIFTAFGVSPVVFGVEKDTTGFNDEDYLQAFKLFNRTKIRPIQKRIVDTLDKVFDTKGSIEIKPFTIEWGENNNDEQIVE